MSDVVPNRKLNVVGGEGPPLSPAEAALLQDKVKRLERAMYDKDGMIQPLLKRTEQLEHGHTRQVTAIATVTFVLGVISAATAVIALLK